MLWWFLVACGGEPASEAAVAEAIAPVDSPFCPSFEACVEGLPRWVPACDTWQAGDPDCEPLDWSEGPADWIDETSRGIAALWSPGLSEAGAGAVPDKGGSPPQQAAKSEKGG